MARRLRPGRFDAIAPWPVLGLLGDEDHAGQEKVYGGLTAAQKRKLAGIAAELKKGGDLSAGPAIRLKPGSRLAREWRGETHDVLVLEDGFEWNGERRHSLSAIAREITGTHWSGPRFFGLKPRPIPFGGEERADG